MQPSSSTISERISTNGAILSNSTLPPGKKIHRRGARCAVAGSEITGIEKQDLGSIVRDNLLRLAVERRALFPIEFPGRLFQQPVELRVV